MLLYLATTRVRKDTTYHCKIRGGRVSWIHSCCSDRSYSTRPNHVRQQAFQHVIVMLSSHCVFGSMTGPPFSATHYPANRGGSRDVTIAIHNTLEPILEYRYIADTNVCKLCSFVLDLTLSRLQRVLSVVYRLQGSCYCVHICADMLGALSSWASGVCKLVAWLKLHLVYFKAALLFYE